MQSRSASIASRRLGLAATEFALVLPLLVMIAFGALDLGRATLMSMALASAVRNGADAGATRGFTDRTRPQWELIVERTVRDSLASHLRADEMDDVDIDVIVDTSSSELPWVTVEATYPVDTTLPWPGWGPTIAVHQESTIRRYR